MSDLDKLLMELATESPAPSKTSKTSKNTSNATRRTTKSSSSKGASVDQDLEALMNDLTSIDTSASSKSKAKNEADTVALEDLVKVLEEEPSTNNESSKGHSTKPKADRELEDLMNALNETDNEPKTKVNRSKSKGKSSKSSTTTKKVTTKEPASKGKPAPAKQASAVKASNDNDLEELMKELTRDKEPSQKEVQVSVSAKSKPPPVEDNNELEDLMNDLASGSVGGNVAGFRSQVSPDKGGEDLEALMFDLVGGQQPPKPVNRAVQNAKAPPVRKDSALENLMEELTAQQYIEPDPEPAPSRARPIKVQHDDDFNDLLNDLSQRKPNQGNELEDLMDSLERNTAPSTKNVKQGNKPNTHDPELDEIMNRLSVNSSSSLSKTNQPPQAKQAPPNNELEALMNDLENAPTSYQAPTQTTKVQNTAELDELMAGLSDHSKPSQRRLQAKPSSANNRPAPNQVASSNNLNFKKPDANSDLDDIMSGLSGNVSVNANVSTNKPGSDLDDIMQNLVSTPSQQPPKGNMQNQRAPGGPRSTKGGADLDGILNSLNNPDNSSTKASPEVAPPVNVPKGVCSGCRKPILGAEQINAMGRSYHKEHFRCSTCGVQIGSGNFFEKEGQPQCENCYQSHFCQKCFHCNSPISNQVLTALGKSWHPTCFICTNCLNPFADGSFFEKEGRPYCGVCYYDVFAQRCRSCNQPIRGTVINALGSAWHPEHFNCQACHRAFTNGQFFDFGGLPYCEQHYRQGL